MNLGFGKLIRTIESEISMKYLPGAIRWCDENFENGWSNAIDRLDKALSSAIERKDFRLAQLEGEFFTATIVDLISKYKQHKNLDEADSFLKSIRKEA